MDMSEVILNLVARAKKRGLIPFEVQEMRIVKIIYSYYFEYPTVGLLMFDFFLRRGRLGGGGLCVWIGAIVAYLLTEKDLGTGGGHF
jgi:hypothetical protein